ncbi:MAG TPA: hypothetical protein VK166_15670 [Chitinophagaceae bacterium]|nr:hypothetical protein [Chitinophagaceae bacterium]
MKRSIIALLALVAFSCSNPVGFKKPEDGLDAGREFIRAVLDGDYKKGELYVIPEEEDLRLYKRYTEYMRKRPGTELIELKQSSIIINKVEELSDTLQIINYSNSYTKRPMDIKVVKKDGEWWVDFSYTFSGNLPITE